MRLPAEEGVGVLGVVRQETAVRAEVADITAQDWIQRGILAEQQLLELRQLAARVQAELVGQRRAGLSEGSQRLGLPAGLVQRAGEQRPASLPERRLCDEDPGRLQHGARVPGADLGLRVQLLRVHAQAGEPGRFDATGLPLLEVGEGRAAPQVQGVLHEVRRSLRVVARPTHLAPAGPAVRSADSPAPSRVRVNR